MNSGSSISELDQCSSCSNTLLKNESKLLFCLHRICNDCIVQQKTDLGIWCNVCKSTTDGQLIEYPQLSLVMCKTTNCCQKAVQLCTICSEVFCIPCSVNHRTVDNEHSKVDKYIFQSLPCHLCPNCINKPAEIYCTQCSKIHCGLCHLKYHNGHNHINLEKIYKDNRCAVISANEDLKLNSKYIDECITITESQASAIEENYNTNKTELKSQWEKSHKEMSHYKERMYDKLEEQYQEKLTAFTKDKVTLQKLKTKNENDTFFTSSILHYNKTFDNARLVEVMKKNQVKNSISKDTPQVLSNVNSDFSEITNSLEPIDKVIRSFTSNSVEQVTSQPLLDLSSIIGVEILNNKIEAEEVDTGLSAANSEVDLTKARSPIKKKRKSNNNKKLQ